MSDEVREFAKDLVTNLLPYGSVARNTFARALQQKRMARCDQFLERTAEYLELGDELSLNDWVGRHADDDWFSAGIESGLRAIQESLGENARRCIAVLVADYLKHARLPDRAYKQVLRFLADCTDETLVTLRQLLGRVNQCGDVNVVALGITTTEPRMMGARHEGTTSGSGAYHTVGEEMHNGPSFHVAWQRQRYEAAAAR